MNDPQTPKPTKPHLGDVLQPPERLLNYLVALVEQLPMDRIRYLIVR